MGRQFFPKNTLPLGNFKNRKHSENCFLNDLTFFNVCENNCKNPTHRSLPLSLYIESNLVSLT